MRKKKQLRELVESGESLKFIALKLEKSKQAIRRKIERLELEVGQKPVDSRTTTSNAVLPHELISMEEALNRVCIAAQKENPDIQ